MAKAPSYKGLRSASEAASNAKRANRARDTKAELLLRSALWRRGARYRLHVRELPGKPDLVFPRHRVAVFVDGDFWHGRNWSERKARLREGTNPAYWVAKIERNRERDRQQDQALRDAGWEVLRVWETDILHDPEAVSEQVIDALQR